MYRVLGKSVARYKDTIRKPNIIKQVLILLPQLLRMVHPYMPVRDDGTDSDLYAYKSCKIFHLALRSPSNGSNALAPRGGPSGPLGPNEAVSPRLTDFPSPPPPPPSPSQCAPPPPPPRQESPPPPPRRLPPRRAMQARVVVFPVKGRAWCFARPRAAAAPAGDGAHPPPPPTLRDLWRGITSGGRTAPEKAESVVDFVADKVLGPTPTHARAGCCSRPCIWVLGGVF